MRKALKINVIGVVKQKKRMPQLIKEQICHEGVVIIAVRRILYSQRTPAPLVRVHHCLVLRRWGTEAR